MHEYVDLDNAGRERAMPGEIKGFAVAQVVFVCMQVGCLFASGVVYKYCPPSLQMEG